LGRKFGKKGFFGIFQNLPRGAGVIKTNWGEELSLRKVLEGEQRANFAGPGFPQFKGGEREPFLSIFKGVGNFVWGPEFLHTPEVILPTGKRKGRI